MADGLNIPAGELAVKVIADMEALKRQLDREIPERAARGGSKAAESFQRGFGERAAPAADRAARTFGRSFEDRLREMAVRTPDRVVPALRGAFERNLRQISSALAKGIIDPEEARRSAREAGENFVRELTKAGDILQRRGLLRPEIARDINREMERVGKEAGRRLGTEVDRGARGPLENLNRFLRGAWRAGIVGAVVIAGTAMVRVFRRVAAQIREALERAGQVQAIRRAFEQLATARGLDPTDLLQKLQAAARGTASAFDLMRSANEAMQAGLPGTSEQLAEMLELSRRLGKSLGTDAEESFRRFVTAVVRGRRQILDDIGVVVDFGAAHEAFARKVGVSVQALTEEQKAAARLEGALEAARTRVASLGEESFTAAERLQQLETATRNVVDAILLGIAESPRFTRVLEALANQALGTADALDAITINVAAFVDTLITLVTDKRLAAAFGNLAAGPALFADAIRVLAGQEPVFVQALLRMTGATETFTEAQEKARQAVQDLQRVSDIRRAQAPEELSPIARAIREDVAAAAAEVAELRAELERLEEARKAAAARRPDPAQLRGFGPGGVPRDLIRIQKEIAETRERLGVAEERRRERLAALQEQVNALSARETQLKAGTLEVTTQLTDEERKAAEAARARLRVLEVLAQEAERVGFPAPREIPEGPLRQAVEDAARLRAEIEKLGAEIESAARVGPVPAAALEELRAKQEELNRVREQALRAAETPEGRLGTEAVQAREKLEELLRVQQMLADLGLGLDEAPPELLALFDALGRNIVQIETLADGIAKLAPEDAALAQAARARIRALEEENDRTRELIATTADLADVFRAFPDLEVSLFAGLDPAEVSRVREGLEQVQAALQGVQAAQLELDLARLAGDKKRVETAAKALRTAETNLQQTLARVAAAIEASNIPLEQKVELLRLIASLSGDAAEESEGLAKTLSTFEGLARGVLSVADAMGALSGETRRALQGVIDLASGLARFKTDPIGGAAQAIGGVVGLISGLFGESPAERERREALRRNTAALDRLRTSLDRQERLLAGLTGRDILALQEFIDTASVTFTERGGGAVATRGAPGESFLETLARMGLTLDDLEAIAAAAGISIENLIGIIERTGGDFQAAAEEWERLREAIRNGTASLAVFEDEFSERMAVLQDRMRAFPDLFDTAIERAEALIAVFAGELPEEIKRQLLAFDLATPEGRAQAIAFLQDLFERRLDPEALGALTPEEFRRGIGDMVDAIGDVEAEIGEAAEAEGGFRAVGVFTGATQGQMDRLLGIEQTILAFVARHLPSIDEALRRALIRLGGSIEGLDILGALPPPPSGVLDLDATDPETRAVLERIEALLAPPVAVRLVEGELGAETSPEGLPGPVPAPRIPDVEPRFDVSPTFDVERSSELTAPALDRIVALLSAPLDVRLVDGAAPTFPVAPPIQPPAPQAPILRAGGGGDINIDVNVAQLGPLVLEGANVRDGAGLLREAARVGAMPLSERLEREVRRRLLNQGIPQ